MHYMHLFLGDCPAYAAVIRLIRNMFIDIWWRGVRSWALFHMPLFLQEFWLYMQECLGILHLGILQEETQNDIC